MADDKELADDDLVDYDDDDLGADAGEATADDKKKGHYVGIHVRRSDKVRQVPMTAQCQPPAKSQMRRRPRPGSSGTALLHASHITGALTSACSARGVRAQPYASGAAGAASDRALLRTAGDSLSQRELAELSAAQSRTSLCFAAAACVS